MSGTFSGVLSEWVLCLLESYKNGTLELRGFLPLPSTWLWRSLRHLISGLAVYNYGDTSPIVRNGYLNSTLPIQMPIFLQIQVCHCNLCVENCIEAFVIPENDSLEFWSYKLRCPSYCSCFSVDHLSIATWDIDQHLKFLA